MRGRRDMNNAQLAPVLSVETEPVSKPGSNFADLLPIYGKSQQNVTRGAAEESIAGVHQHHTSNDRGTCAVQGSSVPRHLVDGRERSPGVEVPQKLALSS